MNESQIIKLIDLKLKCSLTKNEFGSFGDDGFTIPSAHSNEKVILSTDSFVEGVHFNSDTGYFSAGWKSLTSSLSDVYAMGAQPSFYSLNLILPENFVKEKFLEFLEGLEAASKEYNVSLLGGDVTAGKSFVACYQVGGYVHQEFVKSNKGAKKYDVLLTDSPLGEALLGFEQLKKEKIKTKFTEKFLFPRPSKSLGPWLGGFSKVTSLRDISDGLYKELVNLSEINSCRVRLESLPMNNDFVSVCKDTNLVPEAVALEGGEEYSLLWTVEPEFLVEFLTKYKMKFKKTAYVIGQVIREASGKPPVIYENQDLIESIKPFEHFSS